MEENKKEELKDADLQEIVIEEASLDEDKKKKLKKRLFNLIYDVLILVGIGCLLYGGFSLYEGWRDSKQAEESHEELKDNFVSVPTLPQGGEDADGSESTESQTPERPREWYEQIRVDLEGMQTQINPDIIGWIHFENEDISYPLLYSEDNAEYQRVRYDLVYSRGGSIFLEATNRWDLSDIRNVIYGHNMKDESMFGKLKRYNQIKGYYDDHQYFQLLYNGMVYRYQIFSYFTIHQTEVSYINTNFTQGSELYGEFLNKLVENSMKDTGVQVDAEDKTVTLVTCAPDNTYRFIVSAVLVDSHVMANEDGTFPEDKDTEPDDTQPDTEPDDTPPDTEPDEPDTEVPTVRPGADSYTFSDIGVTMMATTGVKIRNKPSLDGIKIANLSKHDTVFVESVCNETGWYRVRYHNGRRIGYVNANYLKEGDLHAESAVFGGTAEAHLVCGECGYVISAEHTLVEKNTEDGKVIYACECGYLTETPPTTETPGTEPSEPGTEPSEPGTEPSEPGAEPSEPGTEPNEPGTQPSEPGTEPSEPGIEPSEPGTQPSEPGAEPSEPGIESSEPSEPGTEPSEPGIEPSEPGVQPGS